MRGQNDIMMRARLLTLDLSRPLDGAEGSLFAWAGDAPLFTDASAAAPASGERLDAGPRVVPSIPVPIRIGGITAARYRFMQWRPGAEAADELPDSGIMDAPGPAAMRALREGLEYFARELWWVDEKTEGPWFFRALREDGKVAYQLLRRTVAPRQDHSSTP